MSDAINAGKDIFSPISSAQASALSEGTVSEVSKDLTSKLDESFVGNQPELTSLQEQLKFEVPTAEGIQFKTAETAGALNIPEMTYKTPSLLEQTSAKKGFVDTFVGAVKEAPGKLGTAMIEGIENYPKKLAETFSSAASTKVMQELGLQQKPEYTTEYYAASIPSIDMAGTTDIGLSQQEPFDAVSYLANNAESINMAPWGFNANIYNAATYQKNIGSRGYGIPFLMGNV